ncbi:hypothetical protein FALBO_1909 [Fusarium albosuccineum]|uniref:Uncharacterized protein n=1 Tax=Fusarium albosuccineum TaxID=1237068 RepID=A0A8H4PI62_9HYPO|nr:hypothetical protein FALBO_1909 [Fusarium albosuccineum]
MSSTVSAPATATTACTNLYDSPNQDTTCAMPYSEKNLDYMKSCCGDAQVVSYYNDCGLYCVALDQTIGDLRDCLFDKGAGWADVFCSVQNKKGDAENSSKLIAAASKTEDADVPATAEASVVANGDDDDKDDSKDDKDSDDSDATSTDTSSASSASSTESGNAAPGVAPQSGVSTLGLAIGALLFSTFAVGAIQI